MRVLLIEEDKFSFLLYETIFDQAGYEVFWAPSIDYGHELMMRFEDFFELVVFRGHIYSSPYLKKKKPPKTVYRI
ncbi:MAG: response regulator transcription factor [Bacteriovoracaceae bacterium]|nr:response regulator transcription factor [Bacteriovoracaceae bacterium]